jgi:O-antigen ligase
MKPAIFDVAAWIPIAFLSIVLPLIALRRNINTGYSFGDVDFRAAAAVYLAMGLISSFYLLKKSSFRNFFTPIDTLLFSLFAFILFQSIYFNSTFIALNLLLFVIIFISVRIASFSVSFRFFLSVSSLAMLTVAVFFMIALGPPVDRWIGGIHPNIFGAICVAAAGLSLFSKGYKRDVTFFVVIVLAAMVSSRYAVATCLLIFFLFYSINFSIIGKGRIFGYGLALLFLIGDLIINSSSSLILSVFEVSSAGRGLGSGISGRDDLWAHFLPQFLENPVVGYGFRSRSSYIGSHNGFLDIALQQGVIGTSILFFYLLIFLTTSAREIFKQSKNQYRGAVFSTLLGLCMGAQLQPQFFSFGDPFGVLTLICLFARGGFEYDKSNSKY